MAIYRIKADGDTVYIDAESEAAAYEYLKTKIGYIPRSMLTFAIVDKLPADEILL